jgi:hypothetical protein
MTTAWFITEISAGTAAVTGRFRRSRRETAGLAGPHTQKTVSLALIDFDRVRASRKSGRGFFTYSKRLSTAR